MALLVLALGALMSICGIASIGYGSGIVADKDWISVLIGVTALSGGFVTTALGLVIRTLQDLRYEIRSGAVGDRSVGFDHAIGSHDEIDARATPRAIGPDEPSAIEPARSSLMTPELESGMLAAILSSRENDHAGAEPSAHHAMHGDDPRSGHEEDAVPVVEPVETDPSRFKVAFKGHPANEPPAVEPDGPAMDDWLDRAFSALDEEIPLSTPHRPQDDPRHHGDHDPARAEVAHAEVAHAELAHAELAHAELTHAELAPAPHAQDLYAEESYLEPAHPEPPHPEPLRNEALAAEAAVIGRYEADGTTYVMYADGSIEAQSAAGIYRFASMAELKVHIESGN